MSLVTRTLAILVGAVLVLVGSAGAPARAAGPETTKAADYIVSTFKPGTTAPYGDVGSAADSMLALLSTADDRYDDEVAGALAYLQKNAKAYVGAKSAGTSGAAKLALAAAAAHVDARSFGGVDLIAEITGGIGTDGAFGAYPGPFSSGVAMVALARNGVEVPGTMVDYLLTYQEPRSGTDGGGFACITYPFDPSGDCPHADPDSTAIAVLGLQAAGSSQAETAASAALDWLKGMQMVDGSWRNFAPVNSTGVVGPLFPADSDQAIRAKAYVASKQLASGALTTGTTTKADLLATQQGIFALTGVTYASVGGTGGSSASPTPSATPTATTPSPQASPSTPPAPAPEPNNLPVVLGVGAVVLLAAAGGAVLLARRRKS